MVIHRRKKILAALGKHGANRMIMMRHACCTLSGIASRNFPPIEGGSGGSHAAPTRSAGAARNLLRTRGSVEDVIARALRLGGSGNIRFSLRSFANNQQERIM